MKIGILITDAESRKSFDLINILTHNYPSFKTILLSEKDVNFQLPLIYNQKIFKTSYSSQFCFEKSLLNAIDQTQCDKYVFIPVSDTAVNYFILGKDKWSKHHVYSLLPDLETFWTANDKLKFQKFCLEKNIPVPHPFSKQEIFCDDFKFQPLIAKPAVGAGSVGLMHVDFKDDLERLTELKEDEYVIQEKIQNLKVEGAFFLVKDGKVISFYSHSRIRMYPPTGGVSVYSKIGYDSVLFKLGSDVLSKLKWNGIAMIEYLYDPNSKKYIILEINPRLWGSFMLSEFAGTKMLLNYINLSLNLKTVTATNLENKFIRWLFPFDILLYLKKFGRIKHFWTLDYKNTCYINNSYASLWKKFSYLIYFIFNVSSIKRLFKKF